MSIHHSAKPKTFPVKLGFLRTKQHVYVSVLLLEYIATAATYLFLKSPHQFSNAVRALIVLILNQFSRNSISLFLFVRTKLNITTKQNSLNIVLQCFIIEQNHEQNHMFRSH